MLLSIPFLHRRQSSGASTAVKTPFKKFVVDVGWGAYPKGQRNSSSAIDLGFLKSYLLLKGLVRKVPCTPTGHHIVGRSQSMSSNGSGPLGQLGHCTPVRSSSKTTLLESGSSKEESLPFFRAGRPKNSSQQQNNKLICAHIKTIKKVEFKEKRTHHWKRVRVGRYHRCRPPFHLFDVAELKRLEPLM